MRLDLVHLTLTAATVNEAIEGTCENVMLLLMLSSKHVPETACNGEWLVSEHACMVNLVVASLHA